MDQIKCLPLPAQIAIAAGTSALVACGLLYVGIKKDIVKWNGLKKQEEIVNAVVVEEVETNKKA